LFPLSWFAIITTPSPVEILQNKLNIQNETDLVSVALSLLNICIQLQEEGYEILATRGDGFWTGRQTRKITIKAFG